MKMNTIFSRVLIMAILLSTFISPSQIFANWGIEVGRANDGDLAELAIDRSAIKVAQSRIARAMILQIEQQRQRELLGLSQNDPTVADLIDSVYDWWRKNVLTPAKSVVANPAASCAEAGDAATALTAMRRQRELFGLDTDEDRKAFFDIMADAGKRCREEALDECVATGRIRQILEVAIQQTRQGTITGASDFDWQSWAKDTLKQCAYYDLHFVSTTHLDASYTVDSVIDGRIKLKFVEDGGPWLGMTLKGETEGGTNPFLVSIKCQFASRGGSIACSPGATPSSYSAEVLAFEMKHREFYVTPDGVSAERIVGDDKFVTKFRAGIFGIQMVVTNRNPPMDITVPFPVGTPFAIAHNKDRIGQDTTVKFENEKRGGLPIIFDFVYADQNAVGRSKADDSTHFELIHKIPDEILKKLYPPRNTQPRQPLRPRSGVST
jgi:hypothetical protein